jgi:hypothetical protein
MAFEVEKADLLEFHQSLSDTQRLMFMEVLSNINIYGEDFIRAGVDTLLIYELKLPPKDTD